MVKCVREIQIYKKNVLNYYLTQKQKTNLINCIKNKNKKSWLHCILQLYKNHKYTMEPYKLLEYNSPVFCRSCYIPLKNSFDKKSSSVLYTHLSIFELVCVVYLF